MGFVAGLSFSRAMSSSFIDPDAKALLREQSRRVADFMSVSKELRHEIPSVQSDLVVVLSFVRSFRKFDFWLLYLLERDRVQDMRYAVEPCSPFVIRTYDMPWRMLAV